MDFLKKYLLAMGLVLGIILGATLIVTILSYFNLIGNVLFKWLKLIVPVISLFCGGFYVGKYAKEKGYMEGIKLGGMFVILMFLFSLLGFGHFKWMMLVYYLILILAAMLGSMIGINRKKEDS